MAVARCVSGIDRQIAGTMASEAIKTMLTALYERQDSFFAENWPILTDHILSVVYKEGVRLTVLRTAMEKDLQAAYANEALLQSAIAVAIKERFASEPDAQTLFDNILAGRTVTLNQHTLSYDRDYEGLAGTNCYGMDYFAGALTLDHVADWRTAMLNGETRGQHSASMWDTWNEDGQGQKSTGSW
jgi:hypothetical protein